MGLVMGQVGVSTGQVGEGGIGVDVHVDFGVGQGQGQVDGSPVCLVGLRGDAEDGINRLEGVKYGLSMSLPVGPRLVDDEFTDFDERLSR